MTQKFSTNNPKNAVFGELRGFCFGHDILTLSGSKLNENNNGKCYTGIDRHYEI